jgi:hypothetical protein
MMTSAIAVIFILGVIGLGIIAVLITDHRKANQRLADRLRRNVEGL